MALLAGSALLAACASLPGGHDPAAAIEGPTNPLALTPTEQYSAGFAEGADEILLASTGGLSANQSAALGELVMRWREDGGSGPIVVTAAGARAASATAAAAAEALRAYGVPPGSVQRADAAPTADAAPVPVRVGFATLTAVLPDCSTRWGSLTHTSSNQPHSGFGCAVSSNIAAMVANPRDLIQPRAAAPADGDRRADVIDKYRKGVSTASARGADERGTLSNAVQ
jgi:pilus assembly protein CpaD